MAALEGLHDVCDGRDHSVAVLQLSLLPSHHGVLAELEKLVALQAHAELI